MSKVYSNKPSKCPQGNIFGDSRGPFLFIIFLSIIFLFVGVYQAPAQEIGLKTVTLNSDPAPGADPGSTFFAFNDVAVNDFGEVSFRAFLETIVYEGCDQGLWTGTPTTLSLVACAGYPAPDTEEGTTFLQPGGGNPGSSVFNELGQIAFNSQLRGDSLSIFNNEGIWVGSPDSLHLVAREGHQAPGITEGVNFIGLATAGIALNNTGQVAFQGHLIGQGIDFTNDKGIWRGSLSENLALIACKGNSAPNTSEGVTFRDIDFARQVNDNGEVIFRGILAGPGVTVENDEGIWLGGPNNLSLAVRTGDAAPGLPIGVKFRPSFGRPNLNNKGEIAFIARVTGSNYHGLWVGSPDFLTLTALSGAPAPGTEPGVVFGNIFDPILNGNGEVAFRAQVYGPSVDSFNNYGIWAGLPDALSLVVRSGDPAPNALPGQRIDNIQHSNVYLNDDGDVAFDADLTGSSEPGVGVWYKSHNDEIVTVAMTGDIIEVMPDDFRMVSAADLAEGEGSGNQDGRRSAHSDSNQIAFRAYFYDGSRGIFLSKFEQTSPAEAIQDLISIIMSLGLNHGIEISLNAKLESALNSYSDEKMTPVERKLDAFINEVEAQKGKKLTNEEADTLMEAAIAIKEMM